MSENKKNYELHQLLATVSIREGQASKLIKEAVNTFSNKDSHFNGRMKVYKPDEEGTDSIADETELVKMVYTVDDKLKFIQKSFIKAVDTIIAKEETNSSGNAKAILKIGNNSYELSATSLLALEKRLVFLRGLYNYIPTLDPTKNWKFNEEKGYYITDKTLRNRIVKKMSTIVVVPATDKFPAQVDKVSVDTKVGVYEEELYSSKLPVEKKAKMLGKIDEIIDAISLARSKANQCVVVEKPIMKDIFNYINN